MKRFGHEFLNFAKSQNFSKKMVGKKFRDFMIEFEIKTNENDIEISINIIEKFMNEIIEELLF